jgi:hypothetical protein
MRATEHIIQDSSMARPKTVAPNSPPAFTTHPRFRRGIYIAPRLTPPSRTNGSRRKGNTRSPPLHRWEQKGITIGSVNIRGLTFLKLLLLLELEDLDILCV